MIDQTVCEDRRMSDDWTRLDTFITGNQKLQAVQLIRHIFKCGLQEAHELMVIRYDELRGAHPEDFQECHEDYWRGSYTSWGGTYSKDLFEEDGERGHL
jgi:hypothetical protein